MEPIAQIPPRLAQHSSTFADACVTRKQIAEYFSVTERTVDRWITDPNLNFPKPLRINRRLFFQASQILAWRPGCEEVAG